MKQPEKRGFARLRAAWGHSLSGLIYAWRREEAFRLEAFILVASVPATALLASSFTEAALMVGSLLFLVIVEVLNSAIEVTIDRISLERHELSGVAKDLGSAAVLLAAIVPAVVWSVVVVSKLRLNLL